MGQARAHNFSRALGPGINIIPSVVRWDTLESTDWQGLSTRVRHVRLCGDLVRSLVDWTACPGRNWAPAHGSTEAQAQAQARAVRSAIGHARERAAAWGGSADCVFVSGQSSVSHDGFEPPAFSDAAHRRARPDRNYSEG